MTRQTLVFHEVPNLYRIIPLHVLRKTPGVSFDLVPTDVLPRMTASTASCMTATPFRPGRLATSIAPGICTLAKTTIFVILHGVRFIEIYIREHSRIESFEATPHQIRQDGQIVYDGPAMLVWPRRMLHRIRSDANVGSSSVKKTVAYEDFDVRTISTSMTSTR